MVWVNIIKALRIASLKSIYPKSSRLVGSEESASSINLSVMNKTTVASCLEVSKKAYLFMTFTP